MTAIGFALLIFGALMACLINPHNWQWDWRDVFSTIPINVGLLLIVAGIVRWLWGVMP